MNIMQKLYSTKWFPLALCLLSFAPATLWYLMFSSPKTDAEVAKMPHQGFIGEVFLVGALLGAMTLACAAYTYSVWRKRLADAEGGCERETK